MRETEINVAPLPSIIWNLPLRSCLTKFEFPGGEEAQIIGMFFPVGITKSCASLVSNGRSVMNVTVPSPFTVKVLVRSFFVSF